MKQIAIVNAKYDDIENILNKFRISYSKCSYEDLEEEQFYNKYRTIFFPCGVDNPIETNVNLLARGTRIHSVSLKKNFLEINENKIYKNIKLFVENGGNAYFSDYSYKLFQGAFKSMEFYDNFPNMGIGGKINLKLKNDLLFFCREPEIKIDMVHPGWIVVKSIGSSEILAESYFETIRNFKNSPIISLIKKGDGDIIYTSYHKSGDCNELDRYIIYRLSYKYLLDKLLESIYPWEQRINCIIIDSVREWENYRSYTIPLEKGNNSVYFLSDNGPFQIDIFNKEKKLIISRDVCETEFYLNIKTDSDQFYNAKIYPSAPRTFGVYSIVSAGGTRILPYYKKFLYGFFIIAILAAIFWINKLFGKKKFSGRIKQK